MTEPKNGRNITQLQTHTELFPSVESIVAPENSYPASYSSRSSTFSLVANNTPNIDLTDYRRSPGYTESPPCFGLHPSNSVTPNNFTETPTDPSPFTFTSDKLWFPKLGYSNQVVQSSANRSTAIDLQHLFMKHSGETYTSSAINCENTGSTYETKPRSALDCLQTWLQQPFACCYDSYDDSTTIERKEMTNNNYGHEDHTEETVTSGFKTKGALLHNKLISSTADSDSTGRNLQGSIHRWDYGRFPGHYGKIESDSLQNASANSDMVNTTKSEINAPGRLSTKSNEPRWRSRNNGHIKKPLNAFMLFMKEMRAQVIAECTLKESAAINQILGRKWHALSREAQAKYYELAKKEKELHQRLYPGWSARDNYATQIRRRNRHVNNVSSTSVPNMIIKPSETQNREYSTRKHNMEHLRTISETDMLFQYNSGPNSTNTLPYSEHNINLPPNWKSQWDSAQGLHFELMKNCSNFVPNDPGWRGSVQTMDSDGQHSSSWNDYPSVTLNQSDNEHVKKTVSTTVHTPLETVLPSGLCKAYEPTQFLETDDFIQSMNSAQSLTLTEFSGWTNPMLRHNNLTGQQNCPDFENTLKLQTLNHLQQSSTIRQSGSCENGPWDPAVSTYPGIDAAVIQKCLCFEASKYHSIPSVHQMPLSTYEQIGSTIDHSQTAGHSSTPDYNTNAHRQTTAHPYSTNVYPISYLSDLAVSQFAGTTSQRESYWDRNTDSAANERISGHQSNFVESSNIQHASVFSSLINSLAST